MTTEPEPPSPDGPTRRPDPGFRALLAANAKVVGAVLVLAFFAYLIWLGLRALFPEIAWLQGTR